MEKQETRSVGLGLMDAALLALVVIWGLNFSVLKGGVAVMPAEVLNTARMGLAALVFAALLGAQRQLRWQPGDGWRIIGLGLVGHAAYQVLFIEGLARTAVGNSALILASVPLWVAIIGALRRTERPSRRAWAGIVLAFSGVAVVILGSNQARSLPGLTGGGDSQASLLGDGLVLLATWCWSAYTAFSPPLLTRYSALQLNGLSLLAAMPPLLAVALLAGLAGGWGQATPEAGLAILYAGLLSVNVAYNIWYRGVQQLGGARTAVYSNLTPLVAIGAAWLLRGEPLQPVYLPGALLIAGGILLTRFDFRSPIAVFRLRNQGDRERQSKI